MKRLRHHVYSLFLTMLVAFFISPNRSFAAESYPQKPIQVVVPFLPGGPTDIGIRILTDQLARILKNPVVVVNKAGGGGSLGTNLVVGAKKDGYTLLGGSTTPIILTPITSPKEVTYDSIRDLEPIAHCISLISCMTVRGDSPFNSFEDLEKYVKANPGKLNIGVSGLEHPYLIYHLLKEQGLNMNLVISKGIPQNVSFLLGGHVDVTINQVGINAPYIREGKMKALVLFWDKHVPFFPDMPTILEKGQNYKSTALPFWIGFFAPKGTPQPILDVLISAFKEASRDPDTVAKFNNLMYPLDFKPGHEFKALIENQQKILREIATKAKLVE